MNLVEIPPALLPAVEELALRGAIPVSKATKQMHLLAKLGLADRSRRAGPVPKFPKTHTVRAHELKEGMHLISRENGYPILSAQPNSIGCIPYPGIVVDLAGARGRVYTKYARVTVSLEPVIRQQFWEEYRLTQATENSLELLRLSSNATSPEPRTPTATWNTSGRLQIDGKYFRIDGQERSVLDALVRLRAASKPQLQRTSRVEDAPKVLRRLVSKYRLDDHVFFPGRPRSGGYRTDIEMCSDSEQD